VFDGWQINASGSTYEIDEHDDRMRRVTYCRQIDGPADGCWIRIKDSGILALPLVCRQIHADARLLLFNPNIQFLLTTVLNLIKFSERLSKEQRNILANMRLQLEGRRGNIPRRLRELGFVGLKKFEPVMGGPGTEILEEDCERLRETFRADEQWASCAKKLEVTCKKPRRY
jgi:hypothetical protein